MQDATAQMALLQFMTAGLPEVAVPTTVHCDHLIQAKVGAIADLQVAEDTNAEVYDFLRTVSAKYGIGFWRPGSGIIHQVVLENYAFPGGMMIGTDSHTPNAGGLGMVAIGVGGADAVDVMTGFPFNMRYPKFIGVHLTGSLHGWTSPKDVILKVAEVLTVKGGTGAIVEYFGPGADSISATGKGTICNMGAEIGATCSLFPYDENMAAYLRSTGRGAIADAANKVAEHLRPDPEVLATPAEHYDQVIEIDLDTLVPHINGPHSPDYARPLADVGDVAKAEGWPLEISSALVGSCTNSSYEDITRAASIARQASAQGARREDPAARHARAQSRCGRPSNATGCWPTSKPSAPPCWPTPAARASASGPAPTSPRARSTSSSTRTTATSRSATTATPTRCLSSPRPTRSWRWRSPARWTSTRRPTRSTAPDGSQVKLSSPHGDQLPSRGFDKGEEGFQAPPDAESERAAVTVVVKPDSDRLQLLEAFTPWDGKDYVELPVLMKAAGKCTTDHISMAGPWLKYRGHLENISGNLFAGAVNAFTGAAGTGIDPIDGETRAYPEIAKHLHEQGVSWVAVGDENYGEGSSREHAAMEPRFRNGKVILVRSFARIHETNLKKQGMLPLTFADPKVYDEIEEGDRLSFLGLADLAPDTPVAAQIVKPDGTTVDFETNHTFSPEQIEWFKAGGALNIIRQRTAKA